MYETQIKNSTNIRLPNQDIKLTRAKRLKQEPNKETPKDKQYDKSQIHVIQLILGRLIILINKRNLE